MKEKAGILKLLVILCFFLLEVNTHSDTHSHSKSKSRSDSAEKDSDSKSLKLLQGKNTPDIYILMYKKDCSVFLTRFFLKYCCVSYYALYISTFWVLAWTSELYSLALCIVFWGNLPLENRDWGWIFPSGRLGQIQGKQLKDAAVK